MVEQDFTPLERYRNICGDYNALISTLKTPLPLSLWCNETRTSAAALSEILRREEIRIHPIRWSPGSFKMIGCEKPGRLWSHMAGLFHIQEEVSMIPAALLDVRPGERVLDLCAAPGNKSLQMAVRMANRGTIVATDINSGRLEALKRNTQRLGLANISICQANGTNLTWDAGRFDKVLVDAPCSCEGTSRKSLKALQWSNPEYSVKLSSLQLALLRKGIQLCRPGGSIVYSTCTYAPEENEAVVNAILKEYGDQVRLRPARLPGLQFSEGLTQWQDQTFDATLRQTLRVWPHQNNSGGFFAALFEKTTDKKVWQVKSEGRGHYRPQYHHNNSDVIKPWLNLLAERFNLKPTHFGHLMLQPGEKGMVHLINPDHKPPLSPVSLLSGLPLLRTNINLPKIPTGAAMRLAPLVRKNAVDLDKDQAMDFLHRKSQDLTGMELQNCSASGFVLVRHAGFGLGVGLLRLRENTPPTLESLFPKAWSPENL
jgi:NOL1/NOP2/sun family putative RNA methylase